jgi:outer membrane protein OmpA-like peptidoglycan-associated protein
MTSVKSILLACSTLTAATALAAPAMATTLQQPFTMAQVVAQAPKPLTPEEMKKLEELKKKAPPPVAKPPAPPPAAAKPAAPPPPAAQAKPVAPPPPAAKAKPVAPPPPPAAQAKPVAPPAAAAQSKPAVPPHAAERRDDRKRGDSADRKPDARPAPGVTPPAPPPAAAQKPLTPAPAPATAQKPAAPAPAPTAAQKPAAPAPAPTAAQKPAVPAPAPTAAQKPAAPAPAPTAAAPKPAAPPPTIVQAPQPAIPAAAAPPPPTKTQSSGQFIQRKGQKPSAGLATLRSERRTTTDGNRTVIREGNRTIVRDGNRATIHHNEADRFAVGARKVTVEHKNDEIISIVLRAAGISIVSTTDRDGRLLRRVRRDRNGRDIVLIDNGFAGARRGDYFVDLPTPRYRGPRDRYILDAGRANRAGIYGILLAPPIEHIGRRYTLDQVRYNYPLREYMPRIDLDINFASGSWQLSPSQVDELSVIAEGLNRAIAKNPREMFLIEGHTDAVGSNEDNLSLSDRRAEAVAVALTEEFQVPPENLVTQGYGEEYLKVDIDGPSRENRRVAVRRITPLIDRTAGR